MNYSISFKSSRSFYFLVAFSVVFGAALLYFFGVLNQFSDHIIEHNRFYNFFGIALVLLVASFLSYERKGINYKLVIKGLILHFSIAIFALKTNVGQFLFHQIANGIGLVYQAADMGINFVFGPLSVVNQASDFIFAVKVLPVIVFFGALMSLLFYLNVVQKIVSGISFFIKPILGTSGPETLCAVANSFLGQTEAPLLIQNYLGNMTKSEFMLVMISGMGSISGSILAVFAGIGVPIKHLLAASFMSIPASIIIAKIIFPQKGETNSYDNTQINVEGSSKNVIDAISSGTIQGLHLALNIGAMLISFIALIYIFNSSLTFISMKLNDLVCYFNWDFRFPILSLEKILGIICFPFGWLFGFSSQEAYMAGQLIGIKIAVNEVIAYSKLVSLDLSDRAKDVLTYALCGFSNFSCIGIQIGSIGALVPNKRSWLSQFGLRAVFGGALANLLSAFVAGLLI